MAVYEKNQSVKSFDTEVVLIDIEKFSLMSALDQVKAAVVANGELEQFLGISLGQSAFKLEEVVVGFVPTGDGFYVILHPQLIGYGVVLALSLRSMLLTASNKTNGLFKGIQAACHYGELSAFVDITEKENFVGPVMNNCARLLGIKSSQAPENFLEDNNYIFCSKESIEIFKVRYNYYQEGSHFKELGVRISDWVEVKDKHGLIHVGAFVEGSRYVAYNPPRPSDFYERVRERLKPYLSGE